MNAAPGAPIEPFALAGFTGEAAVSVLGALHTKVLHDPLRVAQAGQILRPSMSRLTSRVELEGVGPVLLKVHRTRGSAERWLSRIRTSRAAQEFAAARFLAAAGLPVASPLAYGERRRAGALEDSFFMAAFLPDVQPLHDVLAMQPSDRRLALLARVAALVRAMHEAGFDHRDLHAGNILAGRGPGDHCPLWLTDLHRSRMGGTVSLAACRDAVARLLHSLQLLITPAERLHLLDAYQAGAERCELPTNEVLATMRALERRRRASRGKRCFRESTEYTLEVGAGRGARSRTLSLARLDSVLAAHDLASRPGAAGFVKASRKGIVTRHGDLVVKERRPTSTLARWRDRLAPGRHAAGYRHAHMLGVLGVDTARPLAFLQRGGRTFSVFEDLSKLPRLDTLARSLYGGPDRLRQIALREASAAWLGSLHRGGVYHGDLKGVNVLVEQGPRVVGFRLIDTDHCRFFPYPQSVDRRRCVKNLAQLAASIPVAVSRTERLRWYRRYLQYAPPAMQAVRAVARAVAAALARKIVVVDEPIE
ncbi:MAG: hypothetical protein O2894_11690 [Planctomycetota bacterium]|nr:hypothetical protein [Planctomycetota bacterium]